MYSCQNNQTKILVQTLIFCRFQFLETSTFQNQIHFLSSAKKAGELFCCSVLFIFLLLCTVQQVCEMYTLVRSQCLHLAMKGFLAVDQGLQTMAREDILSIMRKCLRIRHHRLSEVPYSNRMPRNI